MGNLGKGFLAGFAATVVLSVLMIMKAMMGIMPSLDIAAMLAKMMGVPGSLIVGWAIHFMIGAIGYGFLIWLLAGKLPGSLTVQGILIGLVGWLIMMIMVLPMAGAGIFGMTLGIMAPIMTLMLHVIFGAVLGWTYGKAVTSDEV
ncbi:MAG: hypothetical protein NVS3B5_11040 [Sphingomicrobium sp.]